VKYLTKLKNEDAYIIAKTILGEGITCTLDWQFPLFLAERDHVCSKVKFSNLPTSQFLIKSENESVMHKTEWN
jgi:hypothetical protein